MSINIVFIILNYKTFEDTAILIKEILNEKILSSKIIVVDNRSPNNSYQQLLNQFKDEEDVDCLLAPTNGGYAIGNNIGLRHAKKYNPNYVCIINNDVHFTKDAINRLILDLEAYEDIGAIAPKQVLPNGNEMLFCDLNLHSFIDDFIDYIWPFHFKRMRYRSNCGRKNLMKVGIVPGAFIFMKYAIMEKIGFFDEATFLFCEERFLAKKLERVCLGCYIDYSISYTHAHSKTIKQENTFYQKQRLILSSRCKYIERMENNGLIKSRILNIVGNLSIYLKSIIITLKS